MNDEKKTRIPLRRIRYHREGEHAIDCVHLLNPLATGIFEYALPIDSSDTTLRLVSYLFESLDENEVFDNEHFQCLLGKINAPEGLTMKSMIKDEFLVVDFLIFNVFKSHDCISRVLNLESKDGFGVYSSMTFLKRLLGSFQSVSILIKNSMFFDVNCILRSILEQISYAYQIIPCKEIDEIKKINPTKSISYLNKLVPEVGYLYGILSSFVHNDNKIWGHYIEIDDRDAGEDSDTYISLRSGRKTKDCIIYFTRAIEAYLAVLINIHDRYCDVENYPLEFIKIINNCSDQIAILKEDMDKKYFTEG